MMTWIVLAAAVALVVGQGIIAIALLLVRRSFGQYSEILMAAQRQNLEIRRNLAIQQNEMVIQEILKHSVPPPPKERQA